MAFRVLIHCPSCDSDKEELVPSGRPTPTVCTDCVKKAAQQSRDKFLAELKALPMADRIERLEAWAYDFEIKWMPILQAAARDSVVF